MITHQRHCDSQPLVLERIIRRDVLCRACRMRFEAWAGIQHHSWSNMHSGFVRRRLRHGQRGVIRIANQLARSPCERVSTILRALSVFCGKWHPPAHNDVLFAWERQGRTTIHDRPLETDTEIAWLQR